MEAKKQYGAPKPEPDNEASNPCVQDELRKLDHGKDDAAYLKWLEAIMRKEDQALSDTVLVNKARRESGGS